MYANSIENKRISFFLFFERRIETAYSYTMSKGRNILDVEVTNISSHGLWILSDNKEYFLSYDQFPWFKNKTIDEIIKVEISGKSHLYWPSLDVDLSLDVIEHPERFPLMADVREQVNTIGN